MSNKSINNKLHKFSKNAEINVLNPLKLSKSIDKYDLENKIEVESIQLNLKLK